MKRQWVVLALLISCTAQAKNVKVDVDGDDAEELAFVLKNMPKVVKSSTKKEFLFSFKNIKCAKTSADVEDDGLPRYSCEKPDLNNVLAARVVFDTLTGAGANTDAAMSHTFVQVKNVHCVVSRDKVTGESHCQFIDENGSDDDDKD